jgi:spermidine synthase
VIVSDAFHDISIPYHLVTREYAELVKSRLTPDGIYLLNVLDAFPDPRLVKSMMKTLSESFEHVHVWMDMVPPEAERMTFVISASDARAAHRPTFASLARPSPSERGRPSTRCRS